MKPLKRRWPVLIAGTVLIAMTGTALAFGPGGNCGSQKAMGAVYRLETLTDSQRQQLDAIRDQRRAAMQEQCQSGKEEHLQLRQAIRDGADPATIRPLAEKQGQRMADRLVLQAEMRREVMAILTPEQQQELNAMAGERSGKRGMGRGW